MARLDRLGSAREIAQIGAVIGRDFPYTLLCAPWLQGAEHTAACHFKKKAAMKRRPSYYF